MLTAAFCSRWRWSSARATRISFLGGWELMTLISGAVIIVARAGDRRARQTVFTYLAVTHLGGVGTWVAILLLADAGAIGDGAAFRRAQGCRSRSVCPH